MPPPDSRVTVRAAWILLGLTCAIAVVPLLGWVAAVPLLGITCALAVVVIVRGGTGHGVVLLISSLVIAPVFILVAPVVTTAFLR